MKSIIAALIAMTSLSGFAHEIEGTLMLKGSLKSKITVNTVKTTCKLKVSKVQNILTEEDSFGNPGYQAKIEVSLDGSDLERNLKVKLDKKLTVINMHEVNGKKIVKDFDYFNSAEGVTVKIDSEGRLLSTTFPYQTQTITCKF